MQHKKKSNRFNFEFKLFPSMVLGGLIFVSLMIGFVVFGQTNMLLNKKIIENAEAIRPAELNLIIIQDSNCEDCFDPRILIESIQKQNVKIVSEEAIDVSSGKGKELVEKFSITKVPTLVVTGEINKEIALKDLWPKIGEVIDDNFVLRQIGTPYLELESGQVRGRVKAIILTDKSCAECYNPLAHEKILASYGWPINSWEIIDRQDETGRSLIQKYNIKLVPALILQGDLEVYGALKQVWPQVGTIEADGAYVFRQGVEQMGAYKNLSTGQVVKPAQPATQ